MQIFIHACDVHVLIRFLVNFMHLTMDLCTRAKDIQQSSGCDSGFVTKVSVRL